ncbi:MAG: histidine kinase [Flavobacterium sp.]|nr:MAG: histidine kinase [Flavobacterium sp.]
MKTSALNILFFLLSFQGFSQELLPFVENFTKSEYNGDNQNWNIVQGSDNAMYFANNHYFLRYNGVKWEKYTLPNKTIIRSVFIDGEKVYCGSYKEFGFWKRTNGKMQYTSVSNTKNLFTGNSDNEEIWKIFKHREKIYFQSFNEIFIYDGKEIEKIKFPFQISYCYVVDGEIYVASVRDGIYVMKESKFIKKQNWSLIDGNIIHHIEKYDGRVFIFTKNNGVYIEEDDQLVQWTHPLNGKLKNEVIVTAKFIKPHTLCIGTGLKGLYIVDLKDNTYQNINRNNSIRNNAVLSIAVDKENDLWLGLDNGIAHVEINSSVNVFTDNSGILGSVYSLSTTDEGYLFVTNHGIFVHKDKQLQAVPNSQGQVWDIYKFNKDFIIGHNDGTFVYNGKQLQKVNPVNGGWKFLKSEFDNVYFQANYSGIVCYKDNDFTKWKVLEKLTKPVRNIAQNRPNELWATDNYRSLYRLTYDKNFVTQKVENVTETNGIASNYEVKIFNYKNEILFLINKNWYTYNSISGKLEKNEVFNSSFKNISDIIPIDEHNFIVLDAGLLYVISQKDAKFSWQLIPEKYYEGRLIIENTKAYKNGNSILLNLDDGFISYKLNAPKNKSNNLAIEGFYHGDLIDDDTKIDYNQTVELHVITEYYGFNTLDLFYSLNGGAELTRIIDGNMVLNNLDSGTQKLELYHFNGKTYEKKAEYSFRVSKPWYFSGWMIVFYVFVIAGSFYLYYKWNKIRYIQKLKLQEEELKHQKKILEIELKAENELNVQEYQKHILELEIQTKSSEVAGKSLSIAKQSEMIDDIQKILDNENDIDKLKNEIKKAIKINAINKHEWEVFETNLNQIHDEFISSLTKKYSNLTSKDIKLCVYLKMNLSSKEIAPLMNITFRGVELHRYRLRKKLGLLSDENLNKFMLEI